MLSKSILRAAVAAAALTAGAATASAEEFRILMLDYVFFPEISFVEPGDVLVFENNTSEQRDVFAADATGTQAVPLPEDGGWALPAIAAGGTATLTITEGMAGNFLTFAAGGQGGTTDGSQAIVGALDFDGPSN